jgi:multiple sugar transport system permease protein
VFIWTIIPIYHMFLFAIPTMADAFSGKLRPAHASFWLRLFQEKR